MLVEQGEGYWLEGDSPAELRSGVVLGITPGCHGRVRASLLTGLVVRHFSVRLELLGGVLSVVELAAVERSAAGRTTGSLRLGSQNPMAMALAAIVRDAGQAGWLQHRCRLLEWASGIMDSRCIVPPDPPGRVCPTRERVHELLRRLTEEDLLLQSPRELARRCGCSARHFSRMFRSETGLSFRDRQTRIRMRKASQLLVETDAKVIHVALDSGYRHLGLFNATFKRFFGSTPGEWRQQAVRQGTRGRAAATGLALWLSWLAVAGPSRAAQPPATPASPAPRFEVRAYEISGNTLMPYTAMEAVLTNYVGASVTFDTVKAALVELQSAYRAHGFATVSVSLPQQQLTNGIVKVLVTEGRLGEITVVNNRHFSTANVLRNLPSLKTNTVLNSLVFQQELDRANASRDRQIYPEIRPGPEPGTTGITLKVKDRLPLHGHLELNNQSPPGTPGLRLNLAGQYNNLWQLEHQVGVQYGITPEGIRPDHLGRAWLLDRPLIANMSGYYRAPIGIGSRDEDRSAVGWQEFGYDEITRRFRPPALSGRPEVLVYGSLSTSDTGLRLGPLTPISTSDALDVQSQASGRDFTVNEDLGARFNLPMPDAGRLRSGLSFGLDYKSYSLTSWNTNTFFNTFKTDNNGVVDIRQEIYPFATPTNQPTIKSVAYLPLSLSWDGGWSDRTGNNSFSLSHTFHLFRLFDGAGAFRESAYTRAASGRFYILGASFTRDQKLPSDWSLRLRADGQWASQPLISNEQFGIGGVAGVRGYRDGQEYGDAGWRALVEPRTPYLHLGDAGNEGHLMPVLLRGSVFLDAGQRVLLEKVAGRRSIQNMAGSGIGLSLSIGDRIDVRCTYGWALISTPSAEAGTARGSFSLNGQF